MAGDFSTCSQHTPHGSALLVTEKNPQEKAARSNEQQVLPAGTELFGPSRTILPAHKNILKWRKGRDKNQILMFTVEKMASLQRGHKFPCESKGNVSAHVFQTPMSFSEGVKPN